MARKRCKLRLEQLAERLALNERTLRRWENGEGAPSVRQLDLLAEALGQPPKWFLGEGESQSKHSSGADVAPEQALIAGIAQRTALLLREEIDVLRREMEQMKQTLAELQQSRNAAYDASADPNIEETDLHGNSMADMLAEADRLHREQGREFRAARTGKALPKSGEVRKPLELDDEGHPKQ